MSPTFAKLHSVPALLWLDYSPHLEGNEQPSGGASKLLSFFTSLSLFFCSGVRTMGVYQESVRSLKLPETSGQGPSQGHDRQRQVPKRSSTAFVSVVIIFLPFSFKGTEESGCTQRCLQASQLMGLSGPPHQQ